MDFLQNTHKQLQQLQELLNKTTDPLIKNILTPSDPQRDPRDPDPRWTWQTHDRLVSGDKCASANPASHLPWSYQSSWSILVNLLISPFFGVVFHLIVGQTRSNHWELLHSRCAKAASSAEQDCRQGMSSSKASSTFSLSCQATGNVNRLRLIPGTYGVPRFWIGSGCFGDPSKQLHHWFMILSKHKLFPLQTMLSQRHVNGPSAIASMQRKRHQSVFLGTWSTPPSENQCIHASVAEVNHLA